MLQEVAGQLSHQSWVYVDTADQLVHLARQTLQQAASVKPHFSFNSFITPFNCSSSIPNLTLAPAIDVLTTGSYPRLPTCIRERIIPKPPLTQAENKESFVLLEGVIRHRLAHESLPPSINVVSICEPLTAGVHVLL